jgi:hypothetical protein
VEDQAEEVASRARQLEGMNRIAVGILNPIKGENKPGSKPWGVLFQLFFEIY